MRLTFLLCALFCISILNLSAQDKPSALIKGESASVSDHLVKLEVGFPNAFGVSYEKKLGQNVSLYSLLGLWAYGGGGIISQANYNVDSYYVITPQITFQPRFYHNLSKRAASDKNIAYNSANYVGISTRLYHTSFAFSNVDELMGGKPVFDLMLSYGFQRSFFKRLNWDMAIQPGIEFYDGQAEFFIGLNLQLGFVVFSR